MNALDEIAQLERAILSERSFLKRQQLLKQIWRLRRQAEQAPALESGPKQSPKPTVERRTAKMLAAS